MRPPRPRALAIWGCALALLLSSACGHGNGEPARPAAASRATGGLLRAVFGTRASRARLQWQNASSTPGASCREALRRAGARFVGVADRRAPAADGCGIPHGVRVSHGPTGIAYQPPLTIECSLALLLPEVEGVIQAEARARLGAPIARIHTFGTYSCRTMRGWGGAMSEHAYGNAIDVASFVTGGGRSVSVARDFRRPTAAGQFLRRLHDRLRAETWLSYVLGPDHDAAHHNHFHLDRGVRWTAF